MADTLPFAGDVKKRAAEGFDRLLLAPVFLIHEIIAVVVPGIIFITLLLLKGNHTLTSAFQTTLIGYKTKLFIAFVFSYLSGKIFSIPANTVASMSFNRMGEYLKDPKNMQDATNRFLAGVLILPELLGAEHALTYLVLSLATTSFYFSSGAVLLVSSLIPGDSNLRLVEAPLGLFLCICGYRGFRPCMRLAISMFGLSLSERIYKMFPGKTAEVWQMGMTLWSTMSGNKVAASAAKTEESKPSLEGEQKLPEKKS